MVTKVFSVKIQIDLKINLSKVPWKTNLPFQLIQFQQPWQLNQPELWIQISNIEQFNKLNIQAYHLLLSYQHPLLYWLLKYVHSPFSLVG